MTRLKNKILTLLKKISHAFVICNSISLFLLILIIFYAQKFEPSVEGLFIPPPTPPYPTAAFLTHTFEILCSISPVICGFTFVILRRINPNNSNNFFLLGSTILTAGFLLNEIYRIHIILQYFDIPKLTTIKTYGFILLLYLLLFWKNLKLTPYGIIITSFLLIIIAVLIDTFYEQFSIKSLLIEGIPKLLGMINFTLYFCLVCYQEIIKEFSKK
ncbi:hypothetical protein CY0110_02079 [Crocosphaera chwakensis CCY0110]|uniref:DUF998 domain-containing protein n=1 Tax=Crocosphaera chwakensis CCY0110 TaxID=391612 RepID=A3IM19_9CHRO|nr:hypothetical protein CY0110_02079 [Crocosphaera chwakensis CCY0110]